MRLKGKTAVITGGNSGIGLGIATEFAREGANVVILGRDKKTLDDAAEGIGNGTLAVQGDVTSRADLDRLFAKTVDSFGKIDVLVANAGVARTAPLGEIDEEAFDFISDINFKGVFFTVQSALPYLNDGASIILNSSIANAKGLPGMSVYSATKAAVRSLARSISAELMQRGIRANVLSPGAIETPIWGRTGMTPEQLDDFSAGIGSQIPVGRFGNVTEMAKAAAFLASDDSSYMVGAEIVADGGLTQL